MFQIDPIKSYEELIELLKSSGIDYDFVQIDKAHEFAKKIHKDQIRISGENYLQHVLAVAGYVAQLNLDNTTIVCSLLHDIVEKGHVSIDIVDKEFGTDVAFIVDGLTNIQKITKTIHDKQIDTENLKHLIFNATEDIRILIIRIAEKLHNLLMSGNGLPDEIKYNSAIKALNIYAPLAEYLGLGYFQRNLEDLAFKIVLSDEYEIVTDTIENHFNSSQEVIEKFINELKILLSSYNIEYHFITSRRKGIYSTYKKAKNKKLDPKEKLKSEDVKKLRDIHAARIILNSIEDCYLVLGLVHSKWEYEREEFDDYISRPKASGYRSLQTAIKFQDIFFEVQIRTQEMHEYNEFGPASHIAYKLRGTNSNLGVKSGSFTWTKDLVKWKDSKELNKEDFKIKAFSTSIFVFTPKGLVIRLDKDSSPIDFAFRIHTDIGYKYQGAKINGKMVSMEYKLQTGDVVEIITTKNPNATLDWLKFTKMNETKSRIKRYLNSKE